jgi:zinc protease
MRSIGFLSLVLSVEFLAGCGTTHPANRPSAAASSGGSGAPLIHQLPTTAPSVNYGAESYRLVEQSGEIVSVLKNGMVVIAKRVSSPVLAVRGYVRTGGVYEGKWLGGGLSHLLEHLVAGGSSQRRTEAQNRDLLQKIGNNSNAYTTENHTAYFINTTPEHLNDAVDLVTGWMLGALITPAEYRREYQVVQRELEKDKGEPDWVFYELTQKNRYRVSPARVPTIGYQEVIQGLSRDDVYGYYKQTYQPNNMVFAVTGDLPPEQLLKAVQKNVRNAKPGRVMSHDIEAEPPVLAPRTIVATFPKLGQARVQLAFPSVRLSSPDLYALDLLSTILGGGESSILVEKLRDQEHLVSAVDCADDTPSYVAGTFEVDMQLDSSKIGAATQAALDALDDVIKNGVSTERLQSAKVQMRAARVRSMQTSEDVASSYAIDYINTGDPHFSDRYIKRIEQTTAKQVQAVAKKYLIHQRLLTTTMLPAEYVGAGGLPRAEDLIRPVAPTTKEAPATRSTEQITRTVLPNGAILLHKRIATSPLVNIKIYAIGGLTAEDAQTNGLGNLTMEMLPRGTKTRDAEQIATFFDSIGGSLDTGSGNNSWYWSATCLKGDFDKTMEVFGDVVNSPVFPQSEFNPMKQRIEAQIRSQDADWHQQSMRFFKKTFFGPENSPYQFLPIGTISNVKGFSRGQVEKWYADKVLPARRVIAIFGDVDLEHARALAQKYLGTGNEIASSSDSTTPSSNTPGQGRSGGTPTPSITIDHVATNKTDQPLAGIVIGFKSKSVIGNPENYPLTVADTLCSGYGYPTGYMFETLRGLGLVYEADAANMPGRSEQYPGTFLAYAGCDPRNVNEVINLMLQNIARVQSSGQDVKWFDRAKQLITTSDALDNETPSAQATTAALDELFGLGYDYHDHFAKRIDAVTMPRVEAVSHSLLNHCVITVSTPLPKRVSVTPGHRTYSSFPPVDLAPHGVQHDAK